MALWILFLNSCTRRRESSFSSPCQVCVLSGVKAGECSIVDENKLQDRDET